MIRALTLLTFLTALLPLGAEPVVHRGVNLGNMLEVPPGQAWNVELKPGYFDVIHSAGFDTVRVPIDWADHAGPAPGFLIDSAFFQRIDAVVAEAEQSRLTLLLDYHQDEKLMKQPDAYADRFIALWKQIAQHYATAPDPVFFELLNEPHDKLDSAHWNALLARAIAAIRPTNPTRTIVVGPVQWNSFDKLAELTLPVEDHHLLATFHYYLPFHFTHQGAGWVGPDSASWLGTTWNGTEAEKTAIAHDFGVAAAWAKAQQRPLFLGEFGSYSTGALDSRARWTACCARTAEQLGIGWSYWEFCASFGLYDPNAQQWRQPLLHALIPPP